MLESELRTKLCAAGRKCGWLSIPVETGNTCLGVPDVYFSKYGAPAVWLECKRIDSRVRGGIKIDYRAGQYATLGKLYSNGCTCILGLIDYDDTVYFIFDDKIKHNYLSITEVRNKALRYLKKPTTTTLESLFVIIANYIKAVYK